MTAHLSVFTPRRSQDNDMHASEASARRIRPRLGMGGPEAIPGVPPVHIGLETQGA